MLKQARIKVAESISKIDKPDDLHWNRWLKKSSSTKMTFDFSHLKKIKQTSLDSSFEETETYDATAFVYSRGLFDKKAFNKWLIVKATKNIKAIIQPSKSLRFFFILVKSESGKNLVPSILKTEVPNSTFTKNDFQSTAVYNYKTIDKSTLTRKIYTAEDIYKSLKDSTGLSEKLKIDPQLKQIIRWELPARDIISDIKTSDKFFLESNTVSENLLPTGKDSKFFAQKSLSRFFFNSTSTSENLLSPATTVYDIRLLSVDKFTTTIYDYSFSAIKNDVRIISASIPSIDNLTKPAIYKLNNLGLSRQPQIFNLGVWPLSDGTKNISDTWAYNYTISTKILNKPYGFELWHEPEIAGKNIVAYPVLTSAEKTNLQFSPQQVEGLYQFQRTGVEFLINKDFALLADDHGLGKSIQAIYALKIMFSKKRIKKALILTNTQEFGSKTLTNLSGNPEGWEGQFYNFAPELSINEIPTNNDLVHIKKSAEILLIDIQLFRENIENGNLTKDFLDKFDCLLLDDFHNIKTVHFISEIFADLSIKFLWLTAAIAGNNSKMIYDNFSSLVNELFRTKLTNDELISFVLGRKKEEVKDELPARIYHNKWFDLTEEQNKEYEIAIQEAEINIYSTIERGNYYIVRPQIFSLLHQLLQVCNFASKEFMNSKAKYLLDHILNSDEKIIILSQYEKLGLDRIEKLLQSHEIKYSIIKAGMKEAAIQSAIQCFKEDKVRIFLVDSKAVQKKFSPGIFSTIIHFDNSWNPASVWQIEDKIEMNGNSPVNIYTYRTRNTVEEKIYKLLAKSGLMQLKIYDGFSPTTLSDLIPTEELLSPFNIKAQEMTEANSITAEITFEEYLKFGQDDLREAVKKFLAKLGFNSLKFLKFNDEKKDDVALATRITSKGEESALFLISIEKNVTVEHLKEFVTLFSDYKNLSKAFIISSGEFTPACRKYLGINNKYFCLIDGKMFFNILRQFKFA